MHMRHPPSTPPSLAQLSQFDLHARLQDLTGVALITFTGPGCGSCRHLRRVLADVREQRPDWHLYEVDAQRESGLTNEFEVFHLPSIFLFHNGAYHSRIEAEARTASIIETVTAALQQPASEAP
ncbi:MAG: thioredoxin family protein [Gammaproteobacteria bacterium]|nr:thioredoxin family protein [Gammaproteobacteria bacterium]